MSMSADTSETLILVGVFGALTVGIMALRLFMRRFRGQSFILSDYLTMVCIVFILARSAFTTVVLLWGNNNMKRPAVDFDPTDVYRREVGSKLTLVNRAVYNTYIWIQKAVVLLLCELILGGLPWPERIVRAYWPILFGSLVAVQATTFAECKPLSLYWQVLPDPGNCINAHVQLVTLVALNITTDAMLILLPMPWLLRVRQSWLRRFQLVGLFSIGLFLIAIAIVRLPYYADSTAQVNRNTWGSVEEFFAAFVANVPTLFSLRRKKQTRHATYPVPSDDGIVVTNTVHLQYMADMDDDGLRISSTGKVERQASDERLVERC